MADGVRFFRKDGKIIPIREAAGAAAAGAAKVGTKLAKLHKQTRFAHGVVVGAGAATAASHGTLKSTNKAVKPNKTLDAAGLGFSVGAGVLAAATFAGGAKGLAAGFFASHALDAAGITANVASVAGKGHKVDRAKQAAKQEARNFVVGNAVFAAGIVGSKTNRAAAFKYAKGVAEGAQKTLAFARKALRVGLAVE